MITVRHSGERGHTRMDWLDSRHTFSFGGYRDPEHMGFRMLRVINDDRVTPSSGFGSHPHRDMEIITYVLDGALGHKDSMGNGSTIRPGEVQRMSAGTGVVHSEWNHSKTEPVHFLQIWIIPEREGLEPGYEQRAFEPHEVRDRLRMVASHDGRDGSLVIHQDAALYATKLGAGKSATLDLAPGRHGWVQVARGAVSLNGVKLETGDGAAVSDETRLDLQAAQDAEILVFDLA
ncbi:MAG TPA: pirin family protein [Candidatus Saccharimonadales bacterium]|nr:pirin family protein [Candidatus Saccharimonadales bacterium]